MPFTSAQLAVAGQYALASFHDGFALQESEMSMPRLIDPVQRSEHCLHPGDCASCGSQEYRVWKGVSVCAYCRSVAATPAARAETPVSRAVRDQMYTSYFSAMAQYHRTRATVRLTTE